MGRQIVTSWRIATAQLALEERLRARHGKVGTLAHLASRSLSQPCYTVADYRALLACGQQAVVFFFYHRVTLAGTLFQSRTIEHRDASARVMDQIRLL
jgi:hypothetical protein